MGSKGKDSDAQVVGAERGNSPTFRGVFEHCLDEKGRVSLPASFRTELSERGESGVVLTNFICDGARCLEGFADDVWRQFEAKLAERSRFDPQVKKLENFYLARAATCRVDRSGRVTIPQHLRTYAGLERDLVFTSSIHGFRIWDSRVWDMVFQDAEAALLDDPGVFIDVDR